MGRLTCPPTTVRLPDHVDAWLTDLAAWAGDARKPGSMVPTAIEMLIAVCAGELRRIPLTVPEASLLADIRSGSMLDTGVGSGMLLTDLLDATAGHTATGESMAAHYEEAHGLEPSGVDRLTDLLTHIGPAGDLALRLAIARWWATAGATTNADSFRAAGLRIMETS